MKDNMKSLADSTTTCTDDLMKAGSALVSQQGAKNSMAAKHQAAMQATYKSIKGDVEVDFFFC